MNIRDTDMRNTLLGQLGLIILLCNIVLALNECGKCNCCINGTSRCEYNNNEDGVCLDGCIDGYYTDSCIHACSNNCLTCSAVSTCITCKNGYYIGYNPENNQYTEDCSLSCPDNCISCISKYNCSICNDGYYNGRQNLSSNVVTYNSYCQHKCRDNCISCTSYDVCTQCKTGFTGDLCDRCEVGKNESVGCVDSCSVGCENKNCTYSGECPSCKEGFTGVKCDRCSDGKFGNLCDQNCPLTCLACYSLTNCSKCIGNRWGNTCQQCPTNCLNCSSNSICTLCDKGFHGELCNKQCNINCLDGRCDQLSGNCNDGCMAGFYGNFCELKCSNDCMNSSCDREHGNCLHGCRTGYNSTKCEKSKEDDNNMSIIIGASVGGGVLVMFVILLIVLVLLIRKRRSGNDQNDNDKRRVTTENETMTYSEINDINTDVIKIDGENISRSAIRDSDISVNGRGTDAVYAKPIKPKEKSEAVKSLNRNSTKLTVDNTTYEKQEKGKTVNKVTIASQPIHTFDINSTALQSTSHTVCATLASVSLNENKQNEAKLDGEDTYYNETAVKRRKTHLDQLPEFVSKKTEKDFVEEFQSLPAKLIKPYVDSQERPNLSKNRYKGIYPYDDTRVVLHDGESDYINASYIHGYNKNKAYIASIGPTYKYMGDMSAFWIMVWQENVGKIVMLTNLEEGGVPKCDQYWPEKDFSLMFANIQITCHIEENYADYIFRSFSVQKDSIKREIFQVHFTAWPDKGTPDDVTSLIEFRQKVNSTKTKLDGPIIVHCSAGIGRTGTYIALDSITNEGEAEGAVDIYAFVRNMREQRVNMIQTVEQYQYLHNAIVHTLTFDSKAVEASMFNEYMKTHPEDHLGNMFEKLQASIEKRSDTEREAVNRNKALVKKNRNCSDIPGDGNRPRLSIARSPGSSDYINAIYVNSFKNVNRFLIAQTPLPDTVEDFLTLIVQENVSCVISMETTSSENKNVGIYCPNDNQTLVNGAFMIKTERGNSTDQYVLRKMKISNKIISGHEEVEIMHVQYTRWGNSKSTPEEPVKFVQFVKDMELKFSGTNIKRPILVHCLTGAKKSGLFCAVSVLLEKTQIDQEVSVANTVRQLKHRRHLAVPDKDQYIFCHHCVNEYLRTFDIYSNFELKT